MIIFAPDFKQYLIVGNEDKIRKSSITLLLEMGTLKSTLKRTLLSFRSNDLRDLIKRLKYYCYFYYKYCLSTVNLIDKDKPK